MKSEVKQKIAQCRALQKMTVADVIGTARFHDNLAAYMTEQRETRKMARASYEAMHKFGAPKGFKLEAHPVDRVIDMPVEAFAAEFMQVIKGESGRARAVREYIRQLGQQAYNLTVAQYVCDEFPELESELIPKGNESGQN